VREVERFQVRAEDGRLWWFALIEGVNTFRPLSGAIQHVPGPTQYVSLDDADRYHIRHKGGDRFTLVDFAPGADDADVTRVRPS
jgi:hypothetical protein